MKLFTTLLIATLTSVAAIAAPTAHVVIAVGAPGNDEYRTLFDEAAEAWQKAAAIGKAKVTIIGFGDPATDDLAALQSAINSNPEDTTPLWIALIGHGTYDGRQAKFNLRGSDLTDTDLSTWLKPLNRPVAIINTTAASAPFLKTLSGENRVIITATKSASRRFLRPLRPIPSPRSRNSRSRPRWRRRHLPPRSLPQSRRRRRRVLRKRRPDRHRRSPHRRQRRRPRNARQLVPRHPRHQDRKRRSQPRWKPRPPAPPKPQQRRTPPHPRATQPAQRPRSRTLRPPRKERNAPGRQLTTQS